MAISWNRVPHRTMYQEIATACGLAMTEVDGRWFFCFTVDLECVTICLNSLNWKRRIKNGQKDRCVLPGGEGL